MKKLKYFFKYSVMYYISIPYDILRYDIPNFFRNIYLFRKELYNFRSFDSIYNLSMFGRSLELTANHIDKYGYEEDVSRNKKVDKMRRAIQLINNIKQDNFIEQAEAQLGHELVHKIRWEVMPGTDLHHMIDDCNEQEQEMNKKISDLADKIEISEWKELCYIIKGQDTCPKDMDFDIYFDGSGLKTWWD